MKRSLFVVITTGQFYQFIFAANGFVAQYAQSSRTVCTYVRSAFCVLCASHFIRTFCIDRSALPLRPLRWRQHRLRHNTQSAI